MARVSVGLRRHARRPRPRAHRRPLRRWHRARGHGAGRRQRRAAQGDERGHASRPPPQERPQPSRRRGDRAARDADHERRPGHARRLARERPHHRLRQDLRPAHGSQRGRHAQGRAAPGHAAPGLGRRLRRGLQDQPPPARASASTRPACAARSTSTASSRPIPRLHPRPKHDLGPDAALDRDVPWQALPCGHARAGHEDHVPVRAARPPRDLLRVRVKRRRGAPRGDGRTPGLRRVHRGRRPTAGA